VPTWNRGLDVGELSSQKPGAAHAQYFTEMPPTMTTRQDLDFEIGSMASIGISDHDVEALFGNDAWAELGSSEHSVGALQGWFSLGMQQ